jgi:hypothetical protein
MSRGWAWTVLVGAVTAMLLASGALPASVGHRPPPSVGGFCGTEFDGRFVGSGGQSTIISLCPGESDMLVAVWGLAPATCRETAKNGGALVGREKGVSAQFDTVPRTLIRPNGSFAVTARSPYQDSDAPKATVRIRGTFNGTTVEGRVTFTTGAWFTYSRCWADGRFRAKLKRSRARPAR